MEPLFGTLEKTSTLRSSETYVARVLKKKPDILITTPNSTRERLDAAESQKSTRIANKRANARKTQAPPPSASPPTSTPMNAKISTPRSRKKSASTATSFLRQPS